MHNAAMDSDELVTVLLRLRAFLEAQRMDWVLTELDDAVALGVVEPKRLRQVNRRGEVQYEELARTESASARGRRRAEEFLSRRPMTDLEKIESILASLRRVLVTSEEVALASVSQLNDLPQQLVADDGPRDAEPSRTRSTKSREPRGRTSVAQIDFVPDQGSASPAVSTEGRRVADARGRTERIIADMERVIRS
jgi:hypothetical protein